MSPICGNLFAMFIKDETNAGVSTSTLPIGLHEFSFGFYGTWPAAPPLSPLLERKNISRTLPFSNARVNVPPLCRVSQMGLGTDFSSTWNDVNALSVSPPLQVHPPP
jgi:hypothetical protein